MKNFFGGPFDFDGDGGLDPFEMGTAFMIFNECTKDDDDEDDDLWSDDDDDLWSDDEEDDWDDEDDEDDWDF